MSPISNSEKQDRYRKKDQLVRHADRIFILWQGSGERYHQTRTPEEVRHALDKIVDLPSGWTDQDYQHAQRKLGQYQLDLLSSGHEIANDVNGDWDSHSVEFLTTPDPGKFVADSKLAISRAQSLAVHIVSALNLSGCNDADQAAAIMEAVRFIGRSLAGTREIRQSSATAFCLASIGPQYDRPTWFAKRLAETIGKQLNESLARQVGQYLINNN